MTWRDKIRPARFRGVPFFIESAEQSGGRRTVVHEYPLKDEPFAEDMGRKARSFTIEGYVIGENYFDARDALLFQLEQPGTGELDHPYHGKRRVVVSGYRVRETTDRGGMASFSIEFEETPAQPAQPTAIVDAAANVRTSAAAATAAVELEFLSKYVSDATRTESVAGMLRSATLAINNALATVSMGTQALANLKRRISEFDDAVASVLDAPEDIAAGFTDMIDLIEHSSVLKKLYEFAAGLRPPETTTNRIIEGTNFDATQFLIQRKAAVAQALLALDTDFDNYDDAVDSRNEITDLLDEQAEVAADDTYPALLQLRADLVKAIPGENSELARLVSHTPPVSVPSLVLAHRLYGNLDLESDLLARNAVQNPMAVPGSRALEVLSHDD